MAFPRARDGHVDFGLRGRFGVCGIWDSLGFVVMAEREIYLTTDRNPKGSGLLAIISQGQPQLGDMNCTVLTLEVVQNRKAAKKWFRRMMVERPWEERH